MILYMPKEKQPEITSFPTENRKLAYTNEFRNLLRENPGIIKTAISLMDRAIEAYNPGKVRIGKEGYELQYDRKKRGWLYARREYVFGDDGKIVLDEHGGAVTEPRDLRIIDFGRGVVLAPGKPIKEKVSGLEVTVIGRSNRDVCVGTFGDLRRLDNCDYIKLNLKGNYFFVKRSFVTQNPGFIEFKNVHRAKELLADLDFVKVVDAQLGYQDKKQSWYISKWEDLEAVGFTPYKHGIGLIGFDDYGKLSGLPTSVEGSYLGFEKEEDFKQAQINYGFIIDKLKPYDLSHDLGQNLFYNFKTKAFILLDVTSGKYNEEMLGEAIIDER